MVKTSSSYLKTSNAKKKAAAPKSAKGVEKGKVHEVKRQPVRQRYTRFKIEVCKDDVSPAQAKKDLILKTGTTAKT